MKKEKKLIIFDLDGTIATEMNFYSEVYSRTLNELIESERGENGLRVLENSRLNYAGQGELALFSLGIAYKKWAELLINAPLDLIKRDEVLVSSIKAIDAKKVIYTGSPSVMANKILNKIGFDREDFDLVIGWEEPEIFPLKWSCSSLIFSNIIKEMKCGDGVFSVGDTWKTDLDPAKRVGAKTIMIRKKEGNPDLFFRDLIEFSDFFSNHNF